MSIREITLRQYGIQGLEAEKKVKAFFRTSDYEINKRVFDKAQEIKPEIASDLYYSVVRGVSYDMICNFSRVPIPKTDFYGYQRKLYGELFKDMREYEKRKCN